MSTSTRTITNGSENAPAEGRGCASPLDIAGRTARRSLEGGAFWSAIALPFVHTPLLATGLHSGGTLAAYLLLLAANVAALVLGHGYARDE